MKFVTLTYLLLVAALLAGCGDSGAGEPADPGLVRIELDKGEPEELLRSYFGAYAAPGGADPFAAGLLVERGGAYFVSVDSLAARVPALASELVDRDGSGHFDWDEFEAFVGATYYDATRPPSTLEAFRAETPYAADDPAWFHVELTGVMTTARRRLFVRENAIRAALEDYAANDGEVIYPVGTVFVGEHVVDGRHVETTTMRKRDDGYWDYAVYDASGELAGATSTPPRSLDAPVQCVGCHFGSKLFEPERSFPAEAPPGPHGPRGIHVDDALRDREVTAFFDEHIRRSDHILGLYATLYVARLRASGDLAPEDARLLENLSL